MLLSPGSGQRLTPSETSAPPVGIGRRRVVQAAVGSALLTMPTLRRAAAQSQPLRIGVLTDMSSWGRDNGGPGSVHAANAAAKEFKGEVAGRKVEIVVGDHKMSPDVGMTIARSWFDEGGVEAIADCRIPRLRSPSADCARTRTASRCCLRRARAN